MPYWRIIASDDGWIYIQSSDLEYWGEFAPDSQNPPLWYRFARQVTQTGAIGNFFKYVYKCMSLQEDK